MAGNVILIGFMGAGKTTVGKILSGKLGLKFVDTDLLVEKEAGMSIRLLFELYGERRFRELEAKVVERVLQDSGLVVACGGGVVLRRGNVDALKRGGVVVYLKVSAEEVYRRLRDDESRPLLLGAGDRLSKIRELLEKREPLYVEAADLVVETDGKRPEEVAEEIERWLKNAGLR